jgi:anaerobic dimethyl sulfoxide reductase subunit C (anchor subunit)
VAGREWPLVLFTLLSQFAVGTYLFVVLPLFFNRSAKPASGGRDPRLALVLIVLGLLAAAALASLFHLGNPKNAANALNNLKQSWLSREIVFELTTLFLLALLALFRALNTRSEVVVRGTALAAGASGLFFLVSMARLYMLPTMPAWNTLFTPGSFLLTALLLGATAAAIAGASGILKPFPSYDQTMLSLTLIVAAVGLAVTLLAAPHFGLWGHRPAAGLKLPAEPCQALFIGRMIFLLAGAILLAYSFKKVAGSLTTPSSRFSALAAFCCFLAAELSGRFLFYGFYLGKR